MKRTLILLTFLVTSYSSLRAETIVKEGPVYDSEGHRTGYQYTDGSHDLYFYDSTWRMVQFVGRTGEITRFSYSADGSVVASKVDGTPATAHP